MSTLSHSQEWLDTTLYPFEHNYLTLTEGSMHYVDEGKGDVILFIHGTPTWSFLYRDHIAKLSKHHRCVAIDHLGFGLSTKSPDYGGTPEWHAKTLHEFIEKLDLRDITLVVHDFGGPIGLGAALQQPDRIKKIVLFNSWLWETESDPAAKKIDRVVNSWLGKFMYLRMNVSPKLLLKQGFSDKKLLSKAMHRHYTAPFPDASTRHGLLKLGQSLVGSSDWYQQQWESLDALKVKDWLILWGTKDSFITPDHLDKWKARLPKAKVETFDCGHFIQEERKEGSIKAIEDFMR